MPHSGLRAVLGGQAQMDVRWTAVSDNRPKREETRVIAVGVILMVLGFIFAIPILWTIGIILLVVGLILLLLGSTGRAVGGRRHYY